MGNKQNVLLILGAGATAAISNGKLPVAADLFKNSFWEENKQKYPYLEQIVSSRKNSSLTDAWVLIDTQFKMKHQSSYNQAMLDKRIKSEWYKNKEYKDVDFNFNKVTEISNCALSEGFYTIIQDGLLLAGLELKHLLYKDYSQKVENLKLYCDLIRFFRNNNISPSVINMNYDCYFENACFCRDTPLQLFRHCNLCGQYHLNYCKPHGGFNVWHINDAILPTVHNPISDYFFNKDIRNEIRPAMVPYFANPDELEEEHAGQWPNVGFYYRTQQERFKQLFEKSDKIISIGYSFSEDDRHVRKLVGEINNTCQKKYLVILKGDNKAKETLNRLFSTEVKLINDGFDDKTLKEIKAFMG